MGLSAKTDDQTGMPLGEGYVTLATSAANALLFRSPAEANQYRLNNPAQFAATNNAGGQFNTETPPAEA